MFEQSTVLSGRAPRRLWQTCAGFMGQALLLGCAVLAPILSPQILPRAMLSIGLVTPGPPPPPAAGPVVRPRGQYAGTRTPHGIFVEPRYIPQGTQRIIDLPPESDVVGVAGGVAGGVEDGVSGGILPEILRAVPTPVIPRVVRPDPVREPAATPTRVTVGGEVQMAAAIYRPDPPYPSIARQARVSGTVELQGVIGADGRMKELRLISGHPLLARSALETVSKWIYRPTLLNGRPVEVIAPITVIFRLN